MSNFDQATHHLVSEAVRRAAVDLAKAQVSPVWRKAVEWLRQDFESALVERIRAEIARDPKGWIAAFHFGWGMAVRNALRQHGFGENEFGIDNMDNIYVQLVEEAVRA